MAQDDSLDALLERTPLLRRIATQEGRLHELIIARGVQK